MRFLLLACSLLFAVGLTAQTDIEVEIDGFEEPYLLLANYYGDKQYIRDTMRRTAKGKYRVQRDTSLAGGMYLLVLPPDNQFVQLLIDPADVTFKVKTKKDALVEAMRIEGNADNALFYDYLKLLSAQRPKAEALRTELEKAAEGDKAAIQAKLERVNTVVTDRQAELLAKHPNTLTAAVVRLNQPLNPPKYEDRAPEQQREAQLRWMQTHYFDQLDLTDERLVRTPFLQQRADFYTENFTVQHPDSLIKAIDYILAEAAPGFENHKFLLVHFLNKFAKSKQVGMDAVYVHLAKEYYCTGKAAWTDAEQLKKICDNATTLEPLLIGKPAPDVQLQTQAGEKMKISDIEGDYTVLLFWRPDCGHCKKSAPQVVEFAEKWQPKGVRMVSVCTKFTKDVPKCWEFIEEKGFGDFLNLVDPYHQSKFQTIYDLKSTPRIFVLDKDKKIVSKGIGAEQLDEVMTFLTKRDAAAIEEAGK